jgi:hypothetical protein
MMEVTKERVNNIHKSIQDEERNVGRVNFKVYKSYFSKMGAIPFFSVVLLGCGVQVSNILKDWWLGYWSDQQTRYCLSFRRLFRKQKRNE